MVRFFLVLIIQSLGIENQEFVFNAERDVEHVASKGRWLQLQSILFVFQEPSS